MADAEVKRRGLTRETVDDFKEINRTIVSASRYMHDRRGEELRMQFGKVWVQNGRATGQSLRPRTGKDRSAAYSRVTQPVSLRGLQENGRGCEYSGIDINCLRRCLVKQGYSMADLSARTLIFAHQS